MDKLRLGQRPTLCHWEGHSGCFERKDALGNIMVSLEPNYSFRGIDWRITYVPYYGAGIKFEAVPVNKCRESDEAKSYAEKFWNSLPEFGL